MKVLKSIACATDGRYKKSETVEVFSRGGGSQSVRSKKNIDAVLESRQEILKGPERKWCNRWGPLLKRTLSFPYLVSNPVLLERKKKSWRSSDPSEVDETQQFEFSDKNVLMVKANLKNKNDSVCLISVDIPEDTETV